MLPVIVDLPCSRILTPFAFVILLVNPIGCDAVGGSPAADGPIVISVGSWTAGCRSYPEELLVILRRTKTVVQAGWFPVTAEKATNGLVETTNVCL